MAKQLIFDDDARKKIKTGVATLARAVKVTLGPTGRHVLLQKSFGGPTVTKDGVTVSKEIELEDPWLQETSAGPLWLIFASKPGQWFQLHQAL